MTSRVVYLSFDGLLEPLGWSQVARVVIELARTGLRYHVISLEKASDLASSEATAQARTELDAAGVRWTAIPYQAGGARAARANLGALGRSLADAVARGVDLVHARSYPPAAVALLARSVARVPYLLDARGYWVDERIESGRQFGDGSSRRVARVVERQLYRRAAGVVTLTELQAEDLRNGRFGSWTGRPVLTIPTCADYEAFRPRDDGSTPPDPFLSAPLVIGLVGSANASYLTTESIALAARVLERRADARLVVMTGQVELFRGLAAQAGVPQDRVLVLKVPHAEMPRWLPWLDWCLHLLRATPAKRASMPTKLAELFAAGVRPIHFGCNDEVGEWIARAGSGLVLTGVSPADIERAAQTVAAQTTRDTELLLRARERTYDHFSLARGVERYRMLLDRILPRA